MQVVFEDKKQAGNDAKEVANLMHQIKREEGL
jgi:hypothetical protein